MNELIIFGILSIIFTETAFFGFFSKDIRTFGDFIPAKLVSLLVGGFLSGTLMLMNELTKNSRGEIFTALSIMLGVIGFFWINWAIYKKQNPNSVSWR